MTISTFSHETTGKETYKAVKVFLPEVTKNVKAVYCVELQAVLFSGGELYTNSFIDDFVKESISGNLEFMPVFPIEKDERDNVIRVRMGVADKPSCVVLDEKEAFHNSLHYHHFVIYNDDNGIIHQVVDTTQQCDELITEQYRLIKRTNLQFKDLKYWSDNGNHKERLTGSMVF